MPGESVQTITVDADLAGQRVDNFLISHLKGLPKSRVYRIIRKGEVRVNGKRCKPHFRLQAGDMVRIPPIYHLPRRDSAIGHFDDLESIILFESEDLLVINKPAGMAVHGGSGQSVGVIESLRHAMPVERRLELVHRLDRGTSGCLMVAKRRPYLRALQDALRQPGTVQKEYLALVHGRWPDQIVEIDQPILTSSETGREKRSRVHATGKTAVTRFEIADSSDEASLLRAFPRTGRTHQIRVHCRWARHPIVGDERYGDEMRDQIMPAPRLMLHAARLSIPPLMDRPPVVVEAPAGRVFLDEVDSRIR